MVKQIGLVDRGNMGWERKESKLVRRFWHEQSKEGMHVCSVVFNLFANLLTVAHQPPLVYGVFQAGVLECSCYWVAISYSNQKNRVAIY